MWHFRPLVLRFGWDVEAVARKVITDCIELMHEGYHADAIITLAGCDKRCSEPTRRGNPSPPIF